MTIHHPEILERKNRKLFELLPGYACNANCRFCSIDVAKRKINGSTEELIRSIFRAKKEGFKNLGIGGGEPTIRKDLFTLVRFAKSINFEVVRIETNGITLAYPDYCNRLIDAGLDFVKLSIHSHKPDVHDRLTRVPGSFKNILKAIKNLQKQYVRIEINTVINKENYIDYPKFIDFFANMGIGSFVIIYPLYTGNMAKNWRCVGVSLKKVEPFLAKTLDRIKDLELDKGLVLNVPPCCLPRHLYALTELSPFNTKLGAPDITIENIDNNRQKAKIKPDNCRKCSYFMDCEGVWNDYIKYFGFKEFIPIN